MLFRSEEGDAPSGRNTPDTPNFYPRPPRGGRPSAPTVLCRFLPYFYPRPPRGGRRLRCTLIFPASLISIHALREEGDPSDYRPNAWTGDFYPRPPRGGRPAALVHFAALAVISIHALREEGDGNPLPLLSGHPISIHALREEGDPMRFSVSTPQENFYPRPPRGGRLMIAFLNS